MKKVHITIIASLLAGFAVAAVTLQAVDRPATAPSSAAAIEHFDQTASTEARIRALEAAVAEERNARQLLEEELLALYDELDGLRDVEPEPVESNEPAAAQAVDLSRAERTIQRGRLMNTGEGRAEALIQAGFSPDRAGWIVKREDELRLEWMQAQFEARRSGDTEALSELYRRSQHAMQGELGVAEYEQYLKAYGRPTNVRVGMIIESSPGQLAGLQPGDEIVRYDGQRVFSYSDINNLQLQGEPGEAVVVDILRDGVPMQIAMPRGPIGIQAGRFRGR